MCFPVKKFVQYILSSVMSLNQWGAIFSRCLGDEVVFFSGGGVTRFQPVSSAGCNDCKL